MSYSVFNGIKAGIAQALEARRGAGAGWEALHVAIDDASQLAYTEILLDENEGKRYRLP